MLRLNTYDYIDSYIKLKGTSTPQSIYTRLSGVKVKDSNNNSEATISYGLVADAIKSLSVHKTIIRVTPHIRDSSNVTSTIMLKRTYLRKVLGFDIVNPIKRIWAVSRCKHNLDDMTPVSWYTIIAVITRYSSNVLVSCNNNTNWLLLEDVIKAIASVPTVDSKPFIDCALVGLSDVMYSEIASLIDVRYVTSTDDKYKGLYLNNN